MEALGQCEEVAIAFAGAATGGVAVEGRGHGLDVFHEVEDGAVGEEAAPLRIEADEVEVVFDRPLRFREDAAKDRWDRENGRSHVEAEARFLELRRLAAE